VPARQAKKAGGIVCLESILGLLTSLKTRAPGSFIMHPPVNLRGVDEAVLTKVHKICLLLLNSTM
jgi:hypothetical protein